MRAASARWVGLRFVKRRNWLRSGPDFSWSLNLNQLLEKSTVVDHGGAQLFGAGLGFAGTHGYGVGGAVVLDDAGMVDGDVFGALFEAGVGIPTRLEKRRNQLIGFGHGALGVIEKASLNGAPVCDEAVSLRGHQLAEIELGDAGHAAREPSFTAAFRALLFHGALIFGAKAVTELEGVALSHARIGDCAEE